MKLEAEPSLQRGILWILLTAFSSTLVGQDGTEDSAEISDRIVTVGEWEPKVERVEKMRNEPEPVDTTLPQPEVDYSSKPLQYETEFHVKPIEAARIKVRDPLDRLDQGYFKIGIGTFTTPIGDAYFSSDRDKSHQYSAHLYHRSSEGGVKNNEHADWSRNGLDLRGKWMERNASWKAGLNYERNVRHHYGFPAGSDTLDLLQNEDIQQRFHDINGKVKWEDHARDSGETDHRVSLDMNHFRALDGGMELNGDLEGRFDRYVQEEHLRLEAGVDHNSYWRPDGNEKEELQHNALLELTPQIVSKGEDWQVKVGLKALSELDRKAEFHFYPRAEAHYVLFDGIFVPYAGIKGGMERNNLRSLSKRNPHLISGQVLKNTNEAYDVYGGIRGSLSDRLNFDVRASKKRLEDLPLFVNAGLGADPSGGNRFGALYDDGELIQVKGDLSYYDGERFKMNLSATYRDYRLEEEARAWHRPLLQSSFHGWYDIQDKFTVEARVRYVAPRKAYSPQETEDTEKRIRNAYIIDIPSYVDANLGLEYRYTKDLSAFIRFNNLLADRYQRWYRYPVQGFQVLGGFTYSL